MQDLIRSRIDSLRKSASTWLDDVRARWSKLSRRDQVATAGAGIVLVLVAAAGLTIAALGGVVRCDQPVCVEIIGPRGERVPPMTPIQLRVVGDIDRDLAVKALQISNEPSGTKKFEGDILTFRPEWPGFARGVKYEVALALPSSVLPEGQQAADFSFTFITDGKLEIAAVFPSDGAAEVALDASIMLQFNRSVAPLTVVTESGPEDVIAFDPPVEGKGKWLNTSLYTFTPAAPGWTPATHYAATVKAGLTNDLGGKLEADYPFSFTTLSPDVASVDPADNTKFVAPQPDVTVQFNQPVDRGSAEASFSLTPSGGSPVAGGFLWPDDRTLVFRPAQALPLDTAFQAVVKPGTLSLGAAATMTAEKRWTFTTVGVPRIVSTDPANGGHSPGGGVSIVFSNPMDQESVESHVTVTPAPQDTPYFSWNPDGLTLYVSFPTEPSSPYRVLLSTGAADRYGQPLAEALDLNFVTDRRPPSYFIFRNGSAGTFNAYLDAKLMVSSVNLDLLNFELYIADARNLITYENNGIRFSPPASSLLRSWTESIAAPTLDQTVVTTTRLATAGSTLPEGVYFIRVTSPAASADKNQSDDMFFVVSSVNVVTKWTQYDVLVWLVDMNTGAPLTNTTLQVLDRGGGAIRTLTTDGDGVGRTEVPRPPSGDYYHGYYVWLQADSRTALAGTGWNNGISAWNFQSSVNFQFMPTELVGYLYTDRPIYRPGETVYFKGVVRSDDDANYSLASEDNLYVAVRDDQGRLVDSHPVRLSEMGTFNTELALSSEAATGVYSAQLTNGAVPAGPDGKEIFGPYVPVITFVSFRVAEFRKPEFEVTVTTDKDSYANGEMINATASADLFFGAPLADADVHWKVTAQPYSFVPEGFDRYSFSDYNPYYFEFDRGQSFESQEFLRGEGIGRTDAQGHFAFSLPADISRDPTSQTYTVEATVTDQNGQSVATFIGVPVHKGNFYIGMRPRDYVSIAGSTSVVDLVTLDTEENPAPNVPVQVNVYLRTWRTVRELDADGEQRYRSESDDTLVQTVNASTGADGTGSFSFVPPRAGAYYLVAQAADARGNQIKSSVFTWASSSEYASWFIGNDDIIQLVADKDEYSPGDTAKILVATPFTNSHGLVTLERGRLRGYQTRDFQTNSDILQVPITSEHVPNIFVGVTLFKPPTPDNPLPQVKFGLVELKVSTDEKQLRVSIEPDREKLNPRDTVTYEITSTDKDGHGVAAELSLALVDLSVLSLQDEFARKPIEAFWSAHPLGVSTGSSFAVSIDRSNELARDRQQGSGGKGGGGGAGDESRTFFPNTAYWEPALETDADGHATVSVTLPDTLTTWRLTARAVTADTRVGDARNDIVTSKDVIVRPAIPRFLVAGDEASLGAIVHNFTSGPLDMAVSLDADGIEIKDGATQTVHVAAGQDALVRWDTTVPLGGDSAKLTFKADGASASDSVRLVLPVYGFWTPETAGTAGETNSRASEAVEVPYYVRPDAGELTVRVSPSLASGVDATLLYLQEYPWESAEVTVSRFLPRLALNRAVEELGLTDLPNSGGVDALVQRSMQRLYRQQHTDGGWGWWVGDDSDPAITAYVLIGLAEARKAGFTVDKEVEDRAAAYLLGELDKPRDVESQQFDLRSYLVYALAQDGRGELGRALALAEQRVSLGNTAKAWLAIAIKLSGGEADDPRLTGLMTDLQGSAVPSATGNHWEEEKYDPNVFANSVMTTAQVLQAFTALQPDHPLVNGTLRWLMVARKEGHWESPHDTAVALLAITDFMIVRKDVQEAFDYRVALNGESRLQGSADRGKVQQEDSVVIEMADLLKDAVNRLDISRTPAGAGRLYYTAHLRYFTPADDVEAATYGIGVSHEYFRGDDDTPVTSVSLGDTVKVKVTLVAPSDLNFLVLEDFLPAGLEPIDTSLKTTPLEFRRLLIEEQRKSYQISKRYSPFGHTDIRDNRIALFARFVQKGVYEYTYFAQATTPGRFNAPPATGYEQYFPEVWGRTDSGIFVVNAEETAIREQRPMQDRNFPVDDTRYGRDIDATAVLMAADNSLSRSTARTVGIEIPFTDAAKAGVRRISGPQHRPMKIAGGQPRRWRAVVILTPSDASQRF